MSQSQKNATLSQRLADALPQDIKFKFYHVSTPPTKCAALFAAPQGAKPERTYCESHFLNISIPYSVEAKKSTEVSILAIEVLIYTTRRLATVFVSKADSTGYLSLATIPRGHVSPLRAIPSTFISYLVEHRQRPNVRLVVSLFARASDQYLFPRSVQNKAKHVSDDRQLVKWWCRVLDPVLRDYPAEDDHTSSVEEEESNTKAQAYLIVPGEDSILSFLPQDVRLNTSLRKRWKHAHPLREISSSPAAPPRCLVPHFPDDPKARFLNELDDELPDSTGNVTESPSKRGSGQWKSVKSLEQFWEMMAFRQECSSGRLVGFIWVVFTPSDVDSQFRESQTDSQDSVLNPPFTFAPSERSSSNLDTLSSPSLKSSVPRRSSGQRRKKLTGPIVPRMPRIKSASSSITITSQPAISEYYIWPSESRGEVVLDDKKYGKATETLLRLDFASQELAADSTQTWIEEVGVLSGLNTSWGQSVVGKCKLPAVASVGHDVGATVLQPKKRKVDSTFENDKTNGSVNTLSARLVRKKPKTQDEQPSQGPATHPAGVINMMGGGLGRKKAKPA
ncbi:hypothetical protein EJ08DRAFT_735991 [Tothia fuscella]|uniref:histone acetyltransferase n=1 Tax=Tothia fuscella TaxID=1048955 RepID=A0A9P4NMB9_9PEZI|nr:hypothetical protein EJ08DRAFT_735991 [Tothia fuscella]